VSSPLVSVVTPTWQRPQTLLAHALRSVAAQTCRDIEHVVVTDGDDAHLTQRLWGAGYDCHGGAHGRRRLVKLGRNWSQVYGEAGGVGTTARLAGALAAAGEWIAYLDDDDDWAPEHLESMLKLAEANPGADLLFSAWRQGECVIGGPEPKVGDIGTSMMMHRPRLLTVSMWQALDGYTADGQLAERWAAAGVRWAFKPEPTVTLREHNHGRPEPAGEPL